MWFSSTSTAGWDITCLSNGEGVSIGFFKFAGNIPDLFLIMGNINAQYFVPKIKFLYFLLKTYNI